MKHTIEVIDVINHGSLYSESKVVKYYYPATLLMMGKIPDYKDDAFFIRRDMFPHENSRDCIECHTGIFYPTTESKLDVSCHVKPIKVVPAPCLVDSSWLGEDNGVIHSHGLHREKLEAGFDHWVGTGSGPHNRPTVTYGVRLLLNHLFNRNLNQTRCAGKVRKRKNGHYYWLEDCETPAVQSQYFHVSNQVQRRVAVCDKHIATSNGFGRVFPDRFNRNPQ